VCQREGLVVERGERNRRDCLLARRQLGDQEVVALVKVVGAGIDALSPSCIRSAVAPIPARPGRRDPGQVLVSPVDIRLIGSFGAGIDADVDGDVAQEPTADPRGSRT